MIPNLNPEQRKGKQRHLGTLRVSPYNMPLLPLPETLDNKLRRIERIQISYESE